MRKDTDTGFLKQILFLLIVGLLSESLGIYLLYIKNYILIIAMVVFICQYIKFNHLVEAFNSKNIKEIKSTLAYTFILAAGAVIVYITAGCADMYFSLLAFLLFLCIIDYGSKRLEKEHGELRLMQLTVLFLLLINLLVKNITYVNNSMLNSSLFVSKIMSRLTGKPSLLGENYTAAMLIALFLIYFIIKAILLTNTKKQWCIWLTVISPILVNFFFLGLWSVLQTTAVISELLKQPIFAPFNLNFVYFLLMLVPLYFTEPAAALKHSQTGFKKARLQYIVFALLLIGNSALFVQNALQKSELHKNVAFYQVEAMPINFDLPTFDKAGLENVGMFGLLPKYLDANGYKTSIINSITKDKLKSIDTLVIINLYQKFTEEEKKDIWEFVKNGGALLLAGDHTGAEQIRDPSNQLLEPVGIFLNFDSAIPLVTSWPGGYEFTRDPILDKIKDNEIKINIGASLSVAPPAKVIIAGKYGYSDSGNMKNREMSYLGDMKYNPGEQMGDVPLVASAAYGKGKVLVFGDTTTFQNTVIAQSFRFIENIFAWLSDRSSDTPVAYTFMASVLILFILCLINFRGLNLKEIVISTSMLLIFISVFHLNTSSIVKSYGDINTDKAFITYSNGEYMAVDKGSESIDGLLANLLRNKFIPFFNADKLIKEPSLDRNVMIINAPTIRFSSGKIKEIKAFTENGGLVVLTTGWREADASKELLKEFGVSVINLPIGRITKKENKDAKAEFWEAWALSTDSGKNVKTLVSVWDYPVIACTKYGKGYFITVGDSAFLLNKNLEDVNKYSQTNIDYLKKLLEQYREGGAINE